MNLLSKEKLQNLFNLRDNFCVSIYMPTEKAGAETRQNSIRFKNLLNQAESQLINGGLTSVQVDEFLREAKKLIDNYDFWQHQQDSLACFIAQNQMYYYRLPENFAELVEVSDRFHLKPLLPLITGDNKFYLLALAQNEIRLFQGSHYSIQQLALPEDTPSSLAEALRYDDPEKQLQFHSATSNGNVIFHGQGIGTTDNKNEILRYFQKVDRGLQSLLDDEKVPLILAGVEYLLPIYQEANSYSRLYQEGIIGNPENLAPEKLHSLAWNIIKPYFEQTKLDAIANYQELLSGEQASADLKLIVSGAYHGQVDTLFIADNVQYWGNFNPQTNALKIEDNPTPENLDLLDFAAIHTFLQGGIVYLMPKQQMPNSEMVAAIFRYPIYVSKVENMFLSK